MVWGTIASPGYERKEPTIPERYDMVAIGAGPAGEKAATQAAYFGKRVAIVDRNPQPGGAAIGTAGIPTKTLRETALYITGFRQRDVYGIGISIGPGLLLDRLKARAAEVTASMAAAVRKNIERHGIDLIQGNARLGPDRTVFVEGGPGEPRTLQADVIVIATGSHPHHPENVPFDDPDVHDSEGILGLDRIPGSLAVVGGGPVGCEYASIFRALGVEVTLIDAADRILPFMDREMSDLLADLFRQMGMRLVLGSGVATVRRGAEGGELQVGLPDGDVLRPDKLLFAAGRGGNTEGLGLAEAGVEVDPRGRILVDGEFRTTADGIYAAGDVIGPPALASVSMEQGRVAACHAFGFSFKETVDPLPPYGIYSIPEVGMVGMTEEAAAAAAIDYEVGRAWFAQNYRAVIAGATEGLVKLVFRRDDRTLLGVHILSENASELIHLGQAVLHAGHTIDHFIDATFNLPTRTEAYKYAAYDGLQRLAAVRR